VIAPSLGNPPARGTEKITDGGGMSTGIELSIPGKSVAVHTARSAADSVAIFRRNSGSR
jgi:hypothetical protein